MSIIRAFFQANRVISERLIDYLPQGPNKALEKYEEVVVHYLQQEKHPIILDVGGGISCSFGASKPRDSRLICLDISEEQLSKNKDADELILADANREIPLRGNSVDFVVSRAVIEHLASPQAFIEHSFRVLKPGGFGIHVLPCKFAPFAIINSLLSATLSRQVLYFFRPECRGYGGFTAYYRHCYYTGMKNIFQNCGFIIKEICLSHSQSLYFTFFLPLFLLISLYEIASLPFKNLASFILIVVQKPPAHEFNLSSFFVSGITSARVGQ
jgi:ubiquinone/menaquinone biosynthesis C-methylase UbiE